MTLNLDERLEHFQNHQASIEDEYGAEVLFRARERIAALEAELVTMRAARRVATALVKARIAEVSGLRGAMGRVAGELRAHVDKSNPEDSLGWCLKQLVEALDA